MRRLPALLAGVAFFSLIGAGGPQPARAADTIWEILELPDHDIEEVCIHVGGDDATYYLLDCREPLTLSLRGPGKLRLLTRHLPREGRTGRRCYTLLIDRSGERVREEPLLAVQSRSATLCGDEGVPVGASEEVVLSFPAGRHRFGVTIEEPGKRVAVRLFREKKVAETEYINFAPRESGRICTLVRPDSGNEYPYYHFSADQPLRFTVNGPTELIVRTRLDFPPEARDAEDSAGNAGAGAGAGEKAANGSAGDEEVAYEVQIFQRQGEAGAFELLETLTYTTELLPETSGRYAGCPEILPGKSRRYDLGVPAGSWCYELRPGESTTRGLTGRILIPKEDIAFGQ